MEIVLWFLSLPIRRNSVSLTFFISPAQKPLEWRHLGNFDNIQKSVTHKLKCIPAEAFQHCYEQWEQALRRRVAAQGNYFVGDKLDWYKQ